MISKLATMLLQDWLLGQFRLFALWLFGTEALAALILGALLFSEARGLDRWLGSFFPLYAVFSSSTGTGGAPKSSAIPGGPAESRGSSPSSTH